MQRAKLLLLMILLLLCAACGSGTPGQPASLPGPSRTPGSTPIVGITRQPGSCFLARIPSTVTISLSKACIRIDSRL